MKFSYNFLQSYVSSNLPSPEDLKELIMKHSFEVEELEQVGSAGSPQVGSDWVFDVSVLPNRAHDCFSHIGMARECAVLSGLKLKEIDYQAKESGNKTKDSLDVEVKEKNLCKRYLGRIVRGIKVEESPTYIKERLISCGLRPINNIVDAVNYVMLETGQPLHAFDFDKISGGEKKKIIVRMAEDEEKIITLDEEEYLLNKEILVISDNEKVLAIAGIKGGKVAGVDNETKTIILEAANFDQRMIRKSSRNIGLRTDASLRFEHSLDLNLTEQAINRAVNLIQEVAGGTIDQGTVDFYPEKSPLKNINLDLRKAERVLGISLDGKQCKDILLSLGFGVDEKKEILSIKVPSFRIDVECQEDLIEELGRIIGYDKVESVLPVSIIIPPKENFDLLWEKKIQDILKESGLTEVYSYSFISESDKEIFSFRDKELVELENPMSVEYKYLRPSLIPNLLKAVQKNQSAFDDIEIFELGKVFHSEGESVDEKRMIAGAIRLKGEDSFYELKGAVDYLLRGLGLANFYYDDFQATPENSKMNIWHTGRSAEIKVDGKEIGFLGEISENILDLTKIKGRVAVFDIEFEKIKKLAEEEHSYEEVSAYPEAVRDLSIIVPNRVKVIDVLNVINTVGEKIVRDVDLFDVYEGGSLGENMKSLAFHIIYQSKEKTLKSEEVDKIQQKIIKELEVNPNWQVRR